MNHFARYILFCLFSFCACLVFAQAQLQSSMYWAVPTQYNPAMAGCDSAINLIVSHRLQWTGLNSAPQRTFIAGDSPYQFGKKRVGFGVSLLQDKTKYFESTLTSGQVSYSINLWGGRLALGAQLGGVRLKFNGNKIRNLDEGFAANNDSIQNPDYEILPDSLPRNDVSGSSFDVGLGVYYERKIHNTEFYGGVSLLHLNEAALSANTTGQNGYAKEVFHLPNTIYFVVGCNINLNNALCIIQPSIFIKSNQKVKEADFTLRATFKNRFWGGVSYRTSDAIVLMAGATIKSFRLYYSYDIGIGGVAKTAKGSHEIMASYSFKMELEKKKKHPHKSIRLL